MNETIESPCPLCKSKAAYYFVDHSNVKYFKCKKCNLFQICTHAEKLITNAPNEYLLSLSLQSGKCTDTTALNITTVDHQVFVEVRDRATLPQ
jgi:hypothetical protein